LANTDGTGAALTRLASIPVTTGEVVTALASYDGSSIMAGTSSVALYVIDNASGGVTAQTLPTTASGSGVTRIEMVIPPAVFQLFRIRPVQTYLLRGGVLFHHDGTAWTNLGGQWVTFTFDRDEGRLFAANDSDVF
jgi:hypothetical protein